MITTRLKNTIRLIDAKFSGSTYVAPPPYDPAAHYKDLSSSEYYLRLIALRHICKQLCDEYMSLEENGYNIDLFMLTPSVSSPMGPGSDSEALPIKFGTLNSYLTDSSQFGFEPLLINGLDKCYCYLPSLRGENPDPRHLNQFFHCEMEMRGDLAAVMHIAESFVKFLCHNLQLSDHLLKGLCADYEASKRLLERAASGESYKIISFNEAVELLQKQGHQKLVNTTGHGRDITSQGELKLLEILKAERPIWIVNYDRDRVPFYQKPDPANTDKVLNADMVFPPLGQASFGGEILGAGQRQDNVKEMYASLKRQGLSAAPYEWYIDLRRNPRYSTTSGFGLGIERLLAWMIGLGNIRDAIIYPRLKNIKTTP